jgi:hypothetical protein
MPPYSQGPCLLKGAIVAIKPATSVCSSQALSYTGAPVETIDLEVTGGYDAPLTLLVWRVQRVLPRHGASSAARWH